MAYTIFRFVIKCCFIFFLVNPSLFGGDYGASFLEIGLGARALSMGGAFCSMTGDGSSFYWNPAGLTYIQKTSISGMYGPQFGSIKNPLGSFHFLGCAQPLPKNSIIAVNWVRLSIKDIPVYPELQGNSYWDRLHDFSLRPSGVPDGYIADTEDAIYFSFAMMNRLQLDLGWDYHKVNVEIPWGVNLKWIHQSLGDGEASGIGVDIGAMVRIHMGEFFEAGKLGHLSFGLNLQDVTGTKISWNTRHQDVVDLNLKWGITYAQPLPGLKGALSLSYDHNSRWKGCSHWGVEYTGFKVLGLRAGLNRGRFTGGAGFSVWIMKVDYAFLSHELDALHRVSCTIAF